MEGLKRVLSTIGSRLSNLLKSLLKIILQSIVIFILMMILLVPMVHLLTVPIPTQIQADLIVDRVAFRMGAPTELKAIKFHSATLSNFEQITFSPTAITDQEVGTLNMVQITGKDAQLLSTVMVETATPSTHHFGALQKLTIAKGATVVLAVEKGEKAHDMLAIEIHNAQESPAPFASLMHQSAFQVETRHCQIEGLPPIFEVTGLSRRHPFIQITGQPEAFKLMLSVPVNQAVEIFPNGVSITAPAFIREYMKAGKRQVETALVKEGKISYPAYPNIKPANFGNSNFLFFGEDDGFQINQVIFDPETKGIKVRLSGHVEAPVTTAPEAFPMHKQDYRLTRSDTIAETSKFRQVIFDILVWLIPIILGIVTINIVRILPYNPQIGK